MPLILNGSTGISGIDGSAGTPSYQGNDSNTGIFYPAADTIAFAEGGVESMRITSDGRLGINNSNPSRQLQSTINVSTAYGDFDAASNQLYLTNTNTTTSAYTGIQMDVGSNSQCAISAIRTGDGEVAMAFASRVAGVRAERMRIDSSGNVGIGTSTITSGAGWTPRLVLSGTSAAAVIKGANSQEVSVGSSNGMYIDCLGNTTGSNNNIIFRNTASNSTFSASERMRIDSSGNVMVAKTDTGITNVGCVFRSAGDIRVTTNGGECLILNRLTSDGTLVEFYQDSALEGTISVSGSTVSYNGGHLARWSQLPDNSKDDTILKGTVMTNLDDMCVWTKDSTVLDNEQLNKMQVSNVEGDTNVAGVFVNWTRDEDCNSDDMNIAMTGDMIIRIAQNVVVQKGDLLMSAGDGTAKPQGDDIVRSKTIAKVTSNYVTCTYADGSYCVPCVLMAC